ncbi:MAG: SGNH/GDSL hydrolase family protein [Armatimonadetes bacterium]|nr:SGNH/GDSL hydrolase family protein [Armatimonadota bacterium]
MLLSIVLAASLAQLRLADGDRVVFYGDSITEQLLYTTYVETLVTTRYPKLNIQWTACGVGGDCTWGGWMGDPETRMKRDVAPQRPTHITVMLGMNDGGYVAFDPKIFATYQEWYGKLVDRMLLLPTKPKLYLIKETPFDEENHPETAFKGYSGTVDRFGNYALELARKRSLEGIDGANPIREFLKIVRKMKPEKASQIIPDAIHPSPAAHLILARAIAESWSVTPLVSRTVLDAASLSVISHERSSIEGWNGMEWNQLDDALPFPIVSECELAHSLGQFAEFNQQILAIKNLQPGIYELHIDGKAVDKGTESEWSLGKNLSNLETPMHQQSREVFKLIAEKAKAFHTRQYDILYNFDKYPAAKPVIAEMDRLIDDIVKRIRVQVRAVEHHFKLAKVQ